MRLIKRKKNGFTLIELILTIIVVGIISSVSAKILLSGIDTYSFVTNMKDATQHARVAMDRMIAELMLVRQNDITYIGNERISFYDQSGTGTSFRKYTSTSGTGGQPTIARGSDFLAGRLGFIDFDYLKSDGTDATSILQLRKINVELSIDALGGYGSVTLRTEIFPRNFMYNNFQ